MGKQSSGSGDRSKPEDRPGYKLIFTKSITLRNGKVLLASQCGLKAFPIWVKA